MVIDSSALLAILFAEPDANRYSDAIAEAATRLLSAANFLESGIVIDNQVNPAAGRQLDRLVDQAGIAIVAVTAAHVAIARQAYLDYGKGNHPAALNFGDCFAYALGKATGEPLLFKGDDFSQTDLRSALA
jgi:ribonuclease VapC